METLPPENIIKPEPFPSISTPVYPPEPMCLDSRPRRHTITRPDSALGLLSEEEEDDCNQQEALDRISGILSNLIQEANDAVNCGIERELRTSKRPPPLLIPAPAERAPSRRLGAHMRDSSLSSVSSLSSSVSSTTSDAALFSPCSPSTSITSTSSSSLLMCSSPPPISPKPPSAVVISSRKTRRRPLSYPMPVTRRSSTTPRMTRRASTLLQDPLLESYKRLDSSMALVDSLSRDLASSDEKKASARFFFGPPAALLVVPLLHIPHAIISMVFDSFFSSNHTRSLLAWAFFFLLGNLFQNFVSSSAKKEEQNPCFPGSYDRQQQQPSILIQRHRCCSCNRRIPRRASHYRKLFYRTPLSPLSSTGMIRSRTQPDPAPMLFRNTGSGTERMMTRRYSF